MGPHPDRTPAVKQERYDPVRDLAEVLAGLQVARSIGGGAALGAARAPFDRLRRHLHLFGWPGADEHERMIRAALAALESVEVARTEET